MLDTHMAGRRSWASGRIGQIQPGNLCDTPWKPRVPMRTGRPCSLKGIRHSKEGNYGLLSIGIWSLILPFDFYQRKARERTILGVRRLYIRGSYLILPRVRNNIYHIFTTQVKTTFNDIVEYNMIHCHQKLMSS